MGIIKKFLPLCPGKSYTTSSCKTPPGPEGSKGIRLSGAISSLPFFISIYAHRTYIHTKTILDHNIISRILVWHLVISNLFYLILVLLCAAFFHLLTHLSHPSARINRNDILLQTKICLEKFFLRIRFLNVIPHRTIVSNNIKFSIIFRIFIRTGIKNRSFQ